MSKKNVANVIIMNDNDEFLIIKRTKTAPTHPLCWDLPGGHIEKGEKAKDAAIREAFEETGLTIEDLKAKNVPNSFRNYFITNKYSGKIEFKENPESGVIEHNDYKWVSIEKYKKMENLSIKPEEIQKAMEKTSLKEQYEAKFGFSLNETSILLKEDFQSRSSDQIGIPENIKEATINKANEIIALTKQNKKYNEILRNMIAETWKQEKFNISDFVIVINRNRPEFSEEFRKAMTIVIDEDYSQSHPLVGFARLIFDGVTNGGKMATSIVYKKMKKILKRIPEPFRDFLQNDFSNTYSDIFDNMFDELNKELVLEFIKIKPSNILLFENNNIDNLFDQEARKISEQYFSDRELEEDIIHVFDDKSYWYAIGTTRCPIEQALAGHCGDSEAGGMPGGDLYSLRKKPEDIAKGEPRLSGKIGYFNKSDYPKVYVTVSFREDIKQVTQIKGMGNDVPPEVTWPHIDWLMQELGVESFFDLTMYLSPGQTAEMNRMIEYLTQKASERGQNIIDSTKRETRIRELRSFARDLDTYTRGPSNTISFEHQLLDQMEEPTLLITSEFKFIKRIRNKNLKKLIDEGTDRAESPTVITLIEIRIKNILEKNNDPTLNLITGKTMRINNPDEIVKSLLSEEMYNFLFPAFPRPGARMKASVEIVKTKKIHSFVIKLRAPQKAITASTIETVGIRFRQEALELHGARKEPKLSDVEYLIPEIYSLAKPAIPQILETLEQKDFENISYEVQEKEIFKGQPPAYKIDFNFSVTDIQIPQNIQSLLEDDEEVQLLEIDVKSVFRDLFSTFTGDDSRPRKNPLLQQNVKVKITKDEDNNTLNTRVKIQINIQNEHDALQRLSFMYELDKMLSDGSLRREIKEEILDSFGIEILDDEPPTSTIDLSDIDLSEQYKAKFGFSLNEVARLLKEDFESKNPEQLSIPENVKQEIITLSNELIPLTKENRQYNELLRNMIGSTWKRFGDNTVGWFIVNSLKSFRAEFTKAYDGIERVPPDYSYPLSTLANFFKRAVESKANIDNVYLYKGMRRVLKKTPEPFKTNIQTLLDNTYSNSLQEIVSILEQNRILKFISYKPTNILSFKNNNITNLLDSKAEDMTSQYFGDLEKERNIIHVFDDKSYWYALGGTYCSVEQALAGHCGDSEAGGMPGGNLYSLRKKPEDIPKGERRLSGKIGYFNKSDYPKVYVTVSFKEDTKQITQIKGMGNETPPQETWPHIDWLVQELGVESFYDLLLYLDPDTKKQMYALEKYLHDKASERGQDISSPNKDINVDYESTIEQLEELSEDIELGSYDSRVLMISSEVNTEGQPSITIKPKFIFNIPIRNKRLENLLNNGLRNIENEIISPEALIQIFSRRLTFMLSLTYYQHLEYMRNLYNKSDLVPLDLEDNIEYMSEDILEFLTSEPLFLSEDMFRVQISKRPNGNIYFEIEANSVGIEFNDPAEATTFLEKARNTSFNLQETKRRLLNIIYFIPEIYTKEGDSEIFEMEKRRETSKFKNIYTHFDFEIQEFRRVFANQNLNFIRKFKFYINNIAMPENQTIFNLENPIHDAALRNIGFDIRSDVVGEKWKTIAGEKARLLPSNNIFKVTYHEDTKTFDLEATMIVNAQNEHTALQKLELLRMLDEQIEDGTLKNEIEKMFQEDFVFENTKNNNKNLLKEQEEVIYEEIKNFLLMEGRKENVFKKYSALGEDALNIIARSDEENNYRNLAWMAKQLSKDPDWNNYSVYGKESAAKEIAEIVQKFIEYRPRLKNKDINAYKNSDHIMMAIHKDVLQPQIEKTRKARQEDPRTKEFIESGEGDVIYEDDTYFVVRPETVEASCYFGAKSSWCIAQQFNTYFREYTEEQGKIFYFIKNDGLRTDDDFRQIAVQIGKDGFEMFWDRHDKPYELQTDDWEEFAEFVSAITEMPIGIAEAMFEKIHEHAEENPPELSALYALSEKVENGDYNTKYATFYGNVEDFSAEGTYHMEPTGYVNIPLTIQDEKVLEFINSLSEDNIRELAEKIEEVLNGATVYEGLDGNEIRVDNFFTLIYDELNIDDAEETLEYHKQQRGDYDSYMNFHITTDAIAPIFVFRFSLFYDIYEYSSITTDAGDAEYFFDLNSRRYSDDTDFSGVLPFIYQLIPELNVGSLTLGDIYDEIFEDKDKFENLDVDFNTSIGDKITDMVAKTVPFSVPNSSDKNIEAAISDVMKRFLKSSKRQIQFDFGEEYGEPEPIIPEYSVEFLGQNKVLLKTEVSVMESPEKIIQTFNFFKMINKYFAQIQEAIIKAVQRQENISEQYKNKFGFSLEEVEYLLEKKKKKKKKKKKSSGKKDACYHKVKSRYKVWPSAYASGALVKCRKVGAKNWGNKSKKKNESVDRGTSIINESSYLTPEIINSIIVLAGGNDDDGLTSEKIDRIIELATSSEGGFKHAQEIVKSYQKETEKETEKIELSTILDKMSPEPLFQLIMDADPDDTIYVESPEGLDIEGRQRPETENLENFFKQNVTHALLLDAAGFSISDDESGGYKPRQKAWDTDNESIMFYDNKNNMYYTDDWHEPETSDLNFGGDYYFKQITPFQIVRAFAFDLTGDESIGYDEEENELNELYHIIQEELSIFLNEKKKKRKKKAGTESSKESNLRDWFKRKGAKGKKGGWVDCNTCRKDKKTGRKKCKPCGRSSGEKRAKYPSCRPTPGACGERGKGKSWGKKSAKGKK